MRPDVHGAPRAGQQAQVVLAASLRVFGGHQSLHCRFVRCQKQVEVFQSVQRGLPMTDPASSASTATAATLILDAGYSVTDQARMSDEVADPETGNYPQTQVGDALPDCRVPERLLDPCLPEESFTWDNVFSQDLGILPAMAAKQMRPLSSYANVADVP
ncbi:hypothetical protein WJX77_007719 [Trebouxia sp. C0004]